MAGRRIHVAVLDTDVPCLPVYTKRGLYSSQFRVLLQAAAGRLNQNPNLHFQNGPLGVHVTAYDVVGGSLPPLGYLRRSPYTIAEVGLDEFSPPAIDAILITGSAASAYDADPWIRNLESFVQTVHAHFPHVKLFGSCFGHQLIAQALLSNPAIDPSSTFHVERSEKGFEMGIHPITLTQEFKAHFPVLDKESELDSKPFRIQLIHGDVVVPTPAAKATAQTAEVSLPSPWMNVGYSAMCDIQGLYYPGRVLSYQGHFEFDVFGNRALCIEFGRRQGWSAEMVSSFIEQIERGIGSGLDGEDEDEAKIAAEVVLLFFAGEDGPQKSGLGAVNGNSFAIGGMLTPPLDST
ncbi:hypothetical protein N7528_004877 [Penicillium herquei]|nr:hypothetical protein N7528_004877 [Penicillium herquei]